MENGLLLVEAAQMDIEIVQRRLVESGVDGWLLYDFHKSNPLAHQVLGIPAEKHLTRRFFYWIPAKGEPVKIVHEIETSALDPLPGQKLIYLKWQTLHACLEEVLREAKHVAMEYSPKNAVPYVSKVDGGIIDLVRGCGCSVVSSSSFLQYFTCVWDQKNLELHLAAAEVLDKTAEKAWNLVSDAFAKGKRITEYDLQQYIRKEIESNGCIMEGLPICAVNAHSADPHYAPPQEGSSEIKKGDFILIDLWCKKNQPEAVYADITRVAVAASAPTPKQQEVFSIVRKAQKQAVERLKEAFAKKEEIRGCDVDEVCRKVITEAGYGAFFTHRTGHNIHTETHGPGANIDSLETFDDRKILPMTCFSVEPGIYLPKEFGIRLEHDVVILEDGQIKVTGGIQDTIKHLL